MNGVNSRLRQSFLVALALTAALMMVIPAAAQDTTTPAPGTISVSGEGIVYAAPDVAYLEIGVQTVDPDLSKAFAQTGDKITGVLNALKQLGIDAKDIQTSGVNVAPQNQYDNNGNMTGVSSYTVSNTVEVTIRKVDQVEAVLTSTIAAGANSINSLSFGIQDTSALEQQARTQAVAQAKDRAQQLATALGVTVGKPITVTEVPQTVPVPVYARMNVAAAPLASSSQPVSQGQLSVTVDVQITFSIGS
ncbi:MAG: DUF541 domain-containing protein [Chloroflexi bacterium]|nr:DUF541 domain-containing protein [Chloroflexota bacterium]